MICVEPKTIKGMVLRCGKCISCRLQRSREWSLRMLHESSYWDCNCFVTLTYNDEHLPEGLTLVKRDYQLFLKRLRKDLKRPLRYFLAGEYGERYVRPHYHVVFFGVSASDYDSINRCWAKGFVKVDVLTEGRIKYCVKYLHKVSGVKADKDYWTSNGLLPPFVVQSNGIGERAAYDLYKSLQDKRYITLHGRKYGVPRYYRKKNLITEDFYADYILNYIKANDIDTSQILTDVDGFDKLLVEADGHYGRTQAVRRHRERIREIVRRRLELEHA